MNKHFSLLAAIILLNACVAGQVKAPVEERMPSNVDQRLNKVERGCWLVITFREQLIY